MSNSYKPGGGNKQQPFIPAGNGERSGEYTNKTTKDVPKLAILNCYIRNIVFKYNFCNSKLVQQVEKTFVSKQGESIRMFGTPNSVVKKIIDDYIVTERYYNDNGEAYLDIDYTFHGNLKKHPFVPHIHRWRKDANGKLERGKWEVFK